MTNIKEKSHEKISGEEYKSLIISAACELEKSKTEINDLNVFPVPDGDTGSNMAGTVSNAAKELLKNESNGVSQAAELTARAMLRGARGNSGVIVSLLFRGIAKGLKNSFECDGSAWANALLLGVEEAYEAVEKPAEGTILTVARKSARAAILASKEKNDFEYVLGAAIDAAEKALDETVKENPVLEKAGVVDAGGMGWLVVMKAMHQTLKDGEIHINEDALLNTIPNRSADFSAYDEGSITFTYCTELIIKKRANDSSVLKLKEYLNGIGDSLVFVDDGEIIKIHIHTNDPYGVLGQGMKCGEFENVKIENMRTQHTEKLMEIPKQKSKPYGFVAVVSGDGMKELFSELGADEIVNGGQTMNPSCEEIALAIEKIDAQTVFVLPNNKNVIMASQQAAKQSEKNVIVIPTHTLPQGISTILAFDESDTPEENRNKMTQAIDGVSTFQITYAVRSTDLDGISIQEGEYLALCENKLLSSGMELNSIIEQIGEKIRQTGKETISIYYGQDVKAHEAQKTLEELTKALKETGADINLYNGGQSVYYYIISAE